MPKNKIKEDAVQNPDLFEEFKTGDANLFFSDLEEKKEVQVITLDKLEDSKANKTGSLSLDLDLTRAFPEGAIVEIFGDEGSGKSSIALEALGQALKANRHCLYIDQERSLQRSLVGSIRTLKPYLEAFLGEEKNAKITVIRASSAERALETARRFAVTFPGAMIVVDSVDSLVPESKMAEEIGIQSMGGNAKLMSEALRILSQDLSKSKSTIIFINQKRDKVGLVFGNPETTGGGKGLRFYAWQRLELLKPGNAQKILNTDNEVVGQRVRYKVIKNKLAPNAGTEGDFPILFGKGIFRELELVEMCCKFGLLQKGGKGGGQVRLPLAKDSKLIGENASKVLSKFNAARYLLLDSETYNYWLTQLETFLSNVKSAPRNEDEISDS